MTEKFDPVSIQAEILITINVNLNVSDLSIMTYKQPKRIAYQFDFYETSTDGMVMIMNKVRG